MLDQDARVIVCAPSKYDPDIVLQPLPGQIEEIEQSIRAFYQPTPLLGRVTAEQLAEQLRKGADGFWFIGHAVAGPDGGIALSDGIWPTRELGRYLLRADVLWSYLNSCDSGSFVELLQSIHPHDVYANITTEIDDKEATRNGVQMAEGIADTGRIYKAYRWVVSGGPSKLRRFPSPEIDEDTISREPRAQAYVPVDEKIREHLVNLEIKLAKLESAFDNSKGDVGDLKELVLDYIRELRSDVVGLKADVRPIVQAGLLAQSRQSDPQQPGWVGRFLAVIAVAGVGIFVALVVLVVYLAVSGG